MFSSGKNKNGCFDCDNCPRTSDEKLSRFCVVWWEYSQINSSGEQRTVKECGFRSLPIFLTEVIKASNRPAAAVESIRNSLLDEIGNQMQTTLLQITGNIQKRLGSK